MYRVSQAENQRGFSKELDEFVRESSTTDLSICPLKWWATNARRFPRVSRLAAQLFSIPATSCPSERVFSTAGNVVNQKRAQLQPQHAEMLVFLYENSRKRCATSEKDSSADSESSDDTDVGDSDDADE